MEKYSDLGLCLRIVLHRFAPSLPACGPGAAQTQAGDPLSQPKARTRSPASGSAAQSRDFGLLEVKTRTDTRPKEWAEVCNSPCVEAHLHGVNTITIAREPYLLAGVDASHLVAEAGETGASD